MSETRYFKTVDTVHDLDGYQMLANMIVVRAADDYIKNLKKLRRYKSESMIYKRAESEVYLIERFFHSDYFDIIQPKVSADYILSKLKEEIENG